MLAQLHREGVLGYDGAPMLDEAGPLTLRGAVEAFNLAVRQARLLAQAVVADEEYRSLGLPVQVDLLRGGNTGRVSMSGASWFEQRSLLVVNHAPAAPEGGAAFVLFGVDLTPPQGRASELVAGAVRLSRPPVETWYHLYRRTTPITPGTALLAEPAEELPEAAITANIAEWRLASRPWLPGVDDEDVRWTVTRLAAACRLWAALA